MEKFIPLSVPNFKGNEEKYVLEAIQSEWVSTGGRFITEFENRIADYVGTKGAVACQSGTAGIHTALIVAGVKPGEEVLVPTLTFIAAVNPVRYVGAEPIFMDCDDSLTIDPDKLEEFCENSCQMIDGDLVNMMTGKKISAMIVVHVFGNMADMIRLKEISKKFNLKLIEDATESLGTHYISGKYAKKFSGTIGDIGVFSFNGNKIITTGGGGMIVTNNKEYLEHAKHLTTQAKSDELYYKHDEVGYNYRMTNLQAALGLAQLEQLENFIKIKTDNYYKYLNRVNEIDGLYMMEFRENVRSNYWFYSVFCENGYVMNRNELIDYLAKFKIQARPVWGLIHNQIPYFDNQSYKISESIIYADSILNIPCSTNLTDSDIEDVLGCLSGLRR